jgi:hypothetical protein
VEKDLKRISLSRRGFLAAGMLAPLIPPWPGASSADPGRSFRVHAWERDRRNPVLRPGPESFDAFCCMNPFVIRRDDAYWMYYAGGDAQGVRRICLATAPVDAIDRWTKRGPILEPGGNGAFDETWCVLPCVHRINGRWHLYYTGRSADTAAGLQAFRGIGLAVSSDLTHWEKTASEPILEGDGFEQWPDNRGIAGGGRILDVPQPDGRALYRMYYTLSTGTPSPDLRVDQSKRAVVAHSWNGLDWFDKRVVLEPRSDADYEDVATIALNVWKTNIGFRALYSAIGTRFRAYAICEARSRDGLVWDRGAPGDNLALPPSGDGWESQMTAYPNVVHEPGRLRLFYCGNNFGATGIGTATADATSSGGSG